MKPIALIAASSIAMLAGSFALAQPQPVPPAGGDQKQERTESREQRRDEWRERRAERARARMEERLSKVRADLKDKAIYEWQLWDASNSQWLHTAHAGVMADGTPFVYAFNYPSGTKFRCQVSANGGTMLSREATLTRTPEASAVPCSETGVSSASRSPRTRTPMAIPVNRATPMLASAVSLIVLLFIFRSLSLAAACWPANRRPCR